MPDQPGEEIDMDQLKQSAAEEQEAPQDADKQRSEHELHAVFPGNVEIGRIGCEDAAVGLTGDDQSVHDEQARAERQHGADARLGAREVRHSEEGDRIARDVIGRQRATNGRGRYCPDDHRT